MSQARAGSAADALATSPGAEVRETAATRWSRRGLTFPFLFVASGLAFALAPGLLGAALLHDGLRRSRLAATRLLAFGLVYLLCEMLGLLASGLLWLAGVLGGASRERVLGSNFRLQVRWARALFAAARRCFGLGLTVGGDDAIGSRPALVFIRHASLADTLLPAVLLSGRHGMRLRYVLKRELLVDPCLDVVGQRLPNVFVHRGSGRSAPEIAAIQALAKGLGPREGVLIYPEGTRATPAKRKRALARLEAIGDAERLARARALRHLLPPRSGGPLGLLEAAPGVDVLFFAHVGLDGMATLGDVLSGGLVGRHIQVAFRREPAAAIPGSREARIRWLEERWGEMDDWVDARRRASDGASGTR